LDWYFNVTRQKLFMALNAYYLTAAATCAKVDTQTNAIQTWDTCIPQIVFSGSPDDARERFEAWLREPGEGDSPQETIIRKITATKFVDKLLTESGNSPLDWPKILEQEVSVLESTPVDDFEQGYWVDIDRVVRPDKLSFSAGTLQSDVPEDIRSGLNWLSDKQFFFLFSILLPPPAPRNPDAEFENAERAEPAAEDSDKTLSPEELYATYPDVCNKEAVAIIRARNSVVAAWLWRRYAANTPLAAHAIRIDPWPGTLDAPDNL
jgi:hypothetical protein